MKKTFAVAALITTSIAAQAQGDFDFLKNHYEETFRALVVLAVMYLIINFIVTIVRLLLENRIKRAIIEKGATETVISQIMPKSSSDKKSAMKWFILLTSIAVGLTIISFSLPLGLHSVIIMIFSIAFGFLGYFFLLKRIDQ